MRELNMRISLKPEALLIIYWTELGKNTLHFFFCSIDVNTKPLFICFSKSFFWLVCLLPGYYCAAVTWAQFTGRNAVNFLVVLGGYGLFFLFLEANFFFLLPSLNFLSRSLTLPWGHRGEPQVPPPQILLWQVLTSCPFKTGDEAWAF